MSGLNQTQMEEVQRIVRESGLAPTQTETVKQLIQQAMVTASAEVQESIRHERQGLAAEFANYQTSFANIVDEKTVEIQKVVTGMNEQLKMTQEKIGEELDKVNAQMASFESGKSIILAELEAKRVLMEEQQTAMESLQGSVQTTIQDMTGQWRGKVEQEFVYPRKRDSEASAMAANHQR